MEYEHKILVESTYKKVEKIDLIESSIKEIKDILGFKKIIAFSGWWQWVKLKLEDSEIENKIKDYSNQIKEKVIRDIISRLQDYDVAILTWWTNWDVPRIATDIAREYGIPTIWVLPKRWEKDSLGKDKLNLEIIVDSFYKDSHYWDESPVFAKLADGMFVIWWWAGTLIEFAHVMKINEALKKYNKQIKKIVPVNWIPWVSDSMHYIPWNDEIKNITFPNFTINNWKEAFDWMKKELDLNDIFRETYK